MKTTLCLLLACAALGAARAGRFDAAPFGVPLPEGNGIYWEDPREIHEVRVTFESPLAHPENLRLEYWGSHWPKQHLPKAVQPGGGDVGWMELGNWYEGGWRVADAETTVEGAAVRFRFRPVNAREFPKLSGYPAAFRSTLKLRVQAAPGLARISKIEAWTDSELIEKSYKIAWSEASSAPVRCEVFNGTLAGESSPSPSISLVRVNQVKNSDPNTFDKTLITAHRGSSAFTFAADDLDQGPLYIPSAGAAVLPAGDPRAYAQLAEAQRARHAETLYERVQEMPEQTWRSAWAGLPPKKSRIYFPLGLDGGRQRFRLNADGSLFFRSNDHYLRNRPGQDTPRLDWEPSPVRVNFGLKGDALERHLEEKTLPICSSLWKQAGLQIRQTAFLTALEGADANGPVPASDAMAVFMAQFDFANRGAAETNVVLPLNFHAGNRPGLRADQDGFLWSGDRLRGQLIASDGARLEPGTARWSWKLAPGQSASVVLKLSYFPLRNSEKESLGRLEFGREREAVAGYWRRRMDQSARLITPEPVLDEFYRAVGSHLLINCERQPDRELRFARVGSFGYGAYGNESCMMVADLDRRGYHKEAQECLDGWLHYQGTVELPGDFDSQAGVFYGDGGYEAGGYNQHHGWILWAMAEHYRFTGDTNWLRHAAPGIVAGADWVIREGRRTESRTDLARGLLPAGRLEDIGDWWFWLSTSCYTWRGLDSAAWALEQIRHPEAARIRRQADRYHRRLLAAFQAAAARSPVVRLRDGTAVPHIPSRVHRRGRSFGWICETLEGAMHLLITRALEPDSPQAKWIVEDYEDNLFLSNQYGYTVGDFDKYWFGRGGMSMQACLLLDVEPYLDRDDVKNALRAMFNAIAVCHFPDVHMNTEHALPEMGDWRGDHFKTSDESNACGWLRQLFVRETGNELWLGQAVPREWLEPGKRCGLERAATYFGPVSILYDAEQDQITAHIDGPKRNPPALWRVRFRHPQGKPIRSVTVDGKTWTGFKGEWVEMPSTPAATIAAHF